MSATHEDGKAAGRRLHIANVVGAGVRDDSSEAVGEGGAHLEGGHAAIGEASVVLAGSVNAELLLHLIVERRKEAVGILLSIASCDNVVGTSGPAATSIVTSIRCPAGVIAVGVITLIANGS